MNSLDPMLKDAKVLIVDDTPANIDVLKSMLSGLGYRIYVATSGESAIKIAATVLPDIIVLDVMMPNMDGYETCQKLKQNVRLARDIPVIFVTAKTGTDDIVRGFQVGAVDYISKPIKAEEVRARISTHLRLQLLIKSQDKIISALEQSTNNSVGEVLNLGHELRTPLNSIIGYARHLEQVSAKDSNDRYQKCTRAILSSGQYLALMINNLLDMAKLDAGRQTVEATEFSLNELLREVKEIIQPISIGAKTTISVQELKPDIMPVTDRLKLKQIMVNLAGNASKFTRDGRIDISVSEQGERIDVHVKDTGVGMSAEDLEKIFNPFEQVSEPAPTIQGTGLGLSISKQFCDLLKGSINAISEPGVGSTFTVSFPRNLT